MKTFTIAAVALGILAAAAASTQAKPLDEETAIRLTQKSMKRCVESYEKTYKPEEVNDYCGCWAVTIINMKTQEEYDAMIRNGEWPNSMKQRNEADRYCSKYLNLPDVTPIRKKKW